MAAWATAFGEPSRIVTSLVTLLLVLGISVAALRRTPTGSQGFGLAAGLTLLAAFAFSKQAFPNYYILVMGLLFLGAAAGQPRDPETATTSDSGAAVPAGATG